MTALASKLLTPKTVVQVSGSASSLSIEEDAAEAKRPARAEEEDPIDDQAHSQSQSQHSMRRLFNFYYQEEVEEGFTKFDNPLC